MQFASLIESWVICGCTTSKMRREYLSREKEVIVPNSKLIRGSPSLFKILPGLLSL